MPKAPAKNTTRGFTMIEVLVATVVIGLLSSFGSTSMGKQAKTGRDTARLKTMQDAFKSLQVKDASGDRQGQLYLFSQTEFQEALAETNTNLSHQVYNNICYFIGMAAGETASGRDNELVIATWGESTSTFDYENPGVIAVGTPQGVSNIIRAGGMQEEHFHCDKPQNFDLVQSTFQGDYVPWSLFLKYQNFRHR